jgi:hypothetical protein
MDTLLDISIPLLSYEMGVVIRKDTELAKKRLCSPENRGGGPGGANTLPTPYAYVWIVHGKSNGGKL